MNRRSLVIAAFGFSVALCLPLEATDNPMAAARPNSNAELQEQRDAAVCWRRLATIDPGDGRANELSRFTLDRFLETAHARSLVLDLCRLFGGSNGPELRSTIMVRFVDRIPAGLDLPEGAFRPTHSNAEAYEVLVRTRLDDAADHSTVFVFGEWPENPECGYTFFYQQAASAMAQTLFHELLHIWFVNSPGSANRPYPTGHGRVARCEFEPEFLDLLAGHAHELSQIEGHIPLDARTIQIGLR